MLVIRCRQGETLLIGNDVEVTVLDISSGRVKFGVSAPREVHVRRRGLEITREQNIAASALRSSDIMRVINCYPAAKNISAEDVKTAETADKKIDGLFQSVAGQDAQHTKFSGSR